MILPVGAANFREAMCIGAEVPKKTGKDLSLSYRRSFLGGWYCKNHRFFFGVGVL